MLRTLMTTLMIALLGSGAGFAAENEKIQEAFVASYGAEAKGDYTTAINAMKKVYDADSYEINIRLGWLHYMAGLFTEASGYYQKCISLRSLSIEARLGYVLPESALGNWDKVENAYMEILKIDPQNSTVNYRIGSIYYGRKDYKRAFTHLEKVVNQHPFSYDGLVLYAWTHLQLGKTTEAKLLFQKVLWLSPEDASATEGLALLK